MNWKVTNLRIFPDVNGLKDVVVRADYKIGVTTGAVELKPGDSFIPFADLNEAKILEWVWSEVDKAAIEDRALRELEAFNRKNQVIEDAQPVEASLPWSGG
jgi:hypothetical protein